MPTTEKATKSLFNTNNPKPIVSGELKSKSVILEESYVNVDVDENGNEMEINSLPISYHSEGIIFEGRIDPSTKNQNPLRQKTLSLRKCPLRRTVPLRGG